jgi:hypothetical protein
MGIEWSAPYIMAPLLFLFADATCALASMQASFALTQELAQPLGQRGNEFSMAGTVDPLYQIGGPRSIQLALKLVF